ncbi:MAG: hypothetical protein IPJ58_06165 [Ardenticatenia bacterium]|nr:hypothetical protein [Ardenticatenia bacterium]
MLSKIRPPSRSGPQPPSSIPASSISVALTRWLLPLVLLVGIGAARWSQARAASMPHLEVALPASDQLVTVTPEGTDEPDPVSTVTPEGTDEPDPVVTVTPEGTDEPGPVTVTAEPDEPTDEPAELTPTPTILPPPTPTPNPSATPAPSPGTLSNISTRAFVGTGDDVMIGGFIVRNGQVKVIVRALGGSLAARGVPGSLLDPRLRLFSGQTVIAENDNWETGSCKTEAPAGLWPTDPREACLVMTLAAGPFTAIVDGVNGTTGVALVEAFHSGGSGELSNISTRARVRIGDEVMIGGFITRTQPMRAIIRGLGSSMAASGVPNTLLNPRIRVFSGQTVIAENDDWNNGNCEIQVSSGLWPKDPKEACLVITLAPGPYTVIVDGVGATQGVGLVEVFNGGR